MKLVESAAEFCLEASVLVSVLGILESAVTERGVPGMGVFLLSVGLGFLFFAMGCILQAARYAMGTEEEGRGNDPGDR